jgi:DhnA family fructose-bisphosphate aldolase class Ia/Fe-S-cluster-containing hydrogenase component 2
MYSSPGKTARMNRLFNPKDGKAVCVAADHGWMSDPTENVINLKKILELVVDGEADGVLMSYGTALRLGNVFQGKDKPAILIRADWMNLPRLGGSNVSNVLPVIKFRKMATSRARDALQMGASGITIYYFIGYSDEFEAINIEQAAVFAQECRKVGLPLIIEPMAVGGMVTGVNIAEILIVSARIAAEIGADALKIPYTGDVMTFRQLVDQAKVPVLVLGGAKSDVPRDALELVDEALRAGASGTVFGRNVTKAKDPKKMVQDLCALVHGIKTIDEIFEPLRDKKIKLRGVSKNCVGCLICETVCSQWHNNTFGTAGARLWIESKPIEQEPPLNKVHVCTLCEACVKICKPGAIIINEKGFLEFKSELCDQCGACAEVCPPKVILFDEKKYPVICDLCGGNPQCVRWCKYDAIVVK